MVWNLAKSEVTPISSHENWMACEIKGIGTDLWFPIFNVYGLMKTEDKLKVWKEITIQANMGGIDRAIIAGDFNALLDVDEKEGGLKKCSKFMEDFREFIEQNKLIDIIPKNGKFTRTNRRLNFSKISEILDWFFAREWWWSGDRELETCIVPQCGSDHLPILLSIGKENHKHRGYFKFLSIWWSDPGFIEKLREWWLEGNKIIGTPRFRLVKRLHCLKHKIKIWNKFSFKNIFSEKLRLDEELKALNQTVMMVGMTKEEYLLENELKKEYNEVLKTEEIYWRDKSRKLWMIEGDRNTKFFHASSKARRIHNKITAIKDEKGQWQMDDEDI
ncbi:uncharacterized protein LOC131078174 [Cryptomeria japonica]|uniref:uncharacterized protein LOC131078174 n=1 Tax=Cryptomeria japonica TaxID=3369 RepID=UPI0027DA80B9|nr:uncharacterized protein LOC131078174 [Cryptomeria japonica]